MRMTLRAPLLALLLGSTALLGACGSDRDSTTTRTTAAAQPSADTRDVQQRLKDIGMYDGAVDGIWGPETQAAVERYQRQRGLAANGRIDEPTRMSLREATAARTGTGAAATTGSTAATASGTGGSQAVALNSTADVRTVQNRLRELNYYRGEATGVWTPETQRSVETFQRERGLPVGQVNQATLSAMGLGNLAMSGSGATTSGGTGMTTPPGTTPNTGPSGGLAQNQDATRQSGANQGTTNPGNTTQGRDTTAMPSESNIAPAAGPGAAGRILMPQQLDRASIRAVQQKLKDDGVYTKGVDGIWGPASRSALSQFQRSRSIEADGRLTPATLTALGIEQSSLRSSAR